MRIIISLIFSSLFSCSQTINEQIHLLEDATPKERVALMNSIKEQLVSMNEETRIDTINTLRKKLQHNNKTSHQNSNVNNIQDEHTSKREKVHQEEALKLQDELHQHENHQNHISEENRRMEITEHSDSTSHNINQSNGAK